ncbi:MAG TPA: serine/threonine-protein kinase, partial [Stackebrandtia sp.]|uniref:serine/threonine-protein kinase n=1 Tax=Stackebrandtia sp. TaxID=2023065 RepID=UPI002D629FB1
MEPLGSNDPRRVGRFRLVGRLGEGGMGVVYLGTSWTGRQVAVKVIHEDLVSDSVARLRFAREVRAARAVNGLFTAPVLRADVDADPPWLATDYLPGVSLWEAVEVFDSGFPTDTVRSLALAMAEALASIHHSGVVHRDLTPRNVMLTADGPRVIDFGISRISGEQPITRPASVLGTRAYVAPERWRGGPPHPSADVFALGACLVFAATGRPPAAGDRGT